MGRSPVGDPVQHTVTVDENRPAGLTVMAEYGVGIPVWDRPTGSGYPFDPSRLRVPGELVEGLRRWNDRYELLALTAFRWESAEVEDA